MNREHAVDTTYAINNIQLLNRMRRQEYSQSDLALVNATYGFAVSLFSCRFQPTGRPFISHIVRTAGVLLAVDADVSLLCAALLHNVYQHGDFGDGVFGQTPAKRQKVRAVIGEHGEKIVAGFATRPWTSKTVCALRDAWRADGGAAFSPIDRDVILLKIADHLEHELDLDPLYTAHSHYKGFTPDANAAMRELCPVLGASLFARELQRTEQELATNTVPPELQHPPGGAAILAPASYCRRFPCALRAGYRQARHGLAPLRRRLANSIKRKTA